MKMLIQHLWTSPMYYISHWPHTYYSMCGWFGHLAKSPLSPLAFSSLAQECGEKEVGNLSLAPKLSKDMSETCN